MPARTTVTVAGRELSVSNLDKVLYPEVGFTKAQVIDYYVRVAPHLLPHIVGRPMTLKRYPNGVAGEFFYEKNCPDHRPDWVRTAKLPTDGSGRWGRPATGPGFIDFCVIDDLPTLVWIMNLASLELHPYLHRVEAYEQPTSVVFDLDPGAPAALLECAEVALQLRALFERIGLVSVVKTSGSKGLQVYVPLNRGATYAEATPFTQAVAQVLERAQPDLVVSKQAKDKRVGKVLVDWSQNSVHKTTAGVYSLRARERPWVSAPVTWDEVEAALDARDVALLTFEAADVIERVERDGDLFEPLLTVEQDLPQLA